MIPATTTDAATAEPAVIARARPTGPTDAPNSCATSTMMGVSTTSKPCAAMVASTSGARRGLFVSARAADAFPAPGAVVLIGRVTL